MATILIVEDDPHISARAVEVLQRRGYATRVEANGAAALLAAHADSPALILMELHMPILDGHDTLIALRHDPHTAHIPIIVIAEQDDQMMLAEALVAGANVLLTKPLEQDSLLAAVERCCPVRAGKRAA